MPVKKAPAKKLSVEELEKAINKQLGPRTLIRANDPSLDIQRIPSGVLSIDLRLGGGFARGRHTELYGDYNVGKTALAYYLIGTAQAMGMTCAFLDVEGTFDPVFAKNTGKVKLKKLVFPSELETGNRAIDIMEAMIRSELFDVIVLDSIAALLPKAERDIDMEAGDMGTHQAKLMSKALRKLTAAMNSVEKKPVLLYINQTRQKVGIVFGSNQIVSGGRAMGFYAATRLNMSRTESLKAKGKQVDPKTGEVKTADLVYGHRVLVRVEKDKTGAAHQADQTTFVFNYHLGGIDPMEDILYCGIITGVVKKSGTKFWVVGSEDETKVGRKNFLKWLRRVEEEDPEWIDELRERILSSTSTIETVEEGESEEDE